MAKLVGEVYRHLGIAPPFPPSGILEGHPGSPRLGEGLAPRVLGTLGGLMGSPQCGVPTPSAGCFPRRTHSFRIGQGATLLTNTSCFRPSGDCPAPYRPLDGMGSPEPAFLVSAIIPAAGLLACLSGPGRKQGGAADPPALWRKGKCGGAGQPLGFVLVGKNTCSPSMWKEAIALWPSSDVSHSCHTFASGALMCTPFAGLTSREL